MRPLLLSACGLLAGCQAPQAPAPPPQTIILVLADDFGTECVSGYGSTSHTTPEIDALGERGARLTNAFAQPLCTPSRVKLLTGRSNARNYLGFSLLAPGERTMAHAFQEAGWNTGAFGKWQLHGASHYGERAGWGSRPEDAGFDRWCLWQVEELGSRYADPELEVDGDLRTFPGRFGTEVFLEQAFAFLDAHAGERNFVFLPLALTHAPFVSPPGYAVEEASEQERFDTMVQYMDQTIGRLEDGLAERGLEEDCLLLFTSDNGSPRSVQARANGRVVLGAKGRPIDDGTRVPLVLSWPRRIEPGVVVSDLVDFSDVLPTLLEAGGVPWTGPPLDGRSFLPQVLGRPGNPRDWIHVHSDPRPWRAGSLRRRFVRGRLLKLHADGRIVRPDEDPLEENPLEESALSEAERAELEFLRRAIGNFPEACPGRLAAEAARAAEEPG